MVIIIPRWNSSNAFHLAEGDIKRNKEKIVPDFVTRNINELQNKGRGMIKLNEKQEI